MSKEEVDENKNEPLVNPPEEEVSKKKILLYYGLTVGAVLLIVIIVFIIAVSLGGSPKSQKNNSFISKYTVEKDKKIKLFDSVLSNSISSMKVDDEEVKVENEISFLTDGEHKVEVILNKELNSTENLFKNCANLKEVDLSNLKIKSLTSMSGMFSGCVQLTSANFTNLKTKTVENMAKMFYDCSSLEKLNLSSFETENLINMESMFENCEKLNFLDIRNFNSKKLTSKSNIFNGLPENGTIFYNSDLFSDDLFKESNVETWELNNVKNK